MSGAAVGSEPQPPLVRPRMPADAPYFACCFER